MVGHECKIDYLSEKYKKIMLSKMVFFLRFSDKWPNLGSWPTTGALPCFSLYNVVEHKPRKKSKLNDQNDQNKL